MKRPKFRLSAKKIVCLVVAVLGLAAGISFALMPIEGFNVSVATDYGYVTAMQVEEKIGIESGDKFISIMSRYKSMWFFFDTKDIEDVCLENFVYIDSVQCTVDGRDINVVVHECKPLIYVPCGETMLLVDQTGKVLKVEDVRSQAYPVYGSKVDSFSIGKIVSVPESELRILNRISTAMDNTDANREVFYRIDKISIQNTGDIIMMTSDGVTINLGSLDNMEENLFTLKKILIEYLNDGQVGFLDFTTGDDPVFTEYK